MRRKDVVVKEYVPDPIFGGGGVGFGPSGCPEKSNLTVGQMETLKFFGITEFQPGRSLTEDERKALRGADIEVKDVYPSWEGVYPE